MTAADALQAAVPALKAAGVPNAARDARILLAHAAGIAVDRLVLHLNDLLSPEATGRFDAAIKARAARQPVSQIIGTRQFWGRAFVVTPDVLDPRPETEVLVAAALERPFTKMLDLGTGSGCILLSCLADMPLASGLGTDISPDALAVARGNALGFGLGDRVKFQEADWFRGLDGRFDLIVSNPPYIAEAEMRDLAPEVRDWEPHLALTPGGDGLAAYRRIAAGASARLVAGGRLMVEIGPGQAHAVAALFVAQGLDGIEVRPDLDGRDRVVLAKKPV
jgi:release factor glutamine methyltransferase